MTSDQEATTEDKSVFCAHCGTENAAGAHSCDRCGERIYFPDPTKPPPMGLVECHRCMTANEARASYCVNCGNSLENAARISVLGTGETARNAPHGQPGGIRLSTRSREPVVRQAPEPGPEPAVRTREPERERERREQARAKAGENEHKRSEASDGENTSGTRSARLPQSARGWNTAAFLIGPIWGPANGVWLGVIGVAFLVIPESMVPLVWRFILYLGYGVFLGLRGNEMAWRARRWSSLEQFKRVQQQWMLLALIVNLALLFIIPILLRS